MTTPHDPRYTLRNEHVNRPNDCDQTTTHEHEPAPVTPAPVPTPTTAPAPAPAPEPVATDIGTAQGPESHPEPVAAPAPTAHLVPLPAAPAHTVALVTSASTPAGLPNTGAQSVSLIPLASALVLAGVLFARVFRTRAPMRG